MTLRLPFHRTTLIVLTILATGCASIGPGTIPRDRTSYLNGVSTSWKNQTLLNIVRIRYADTPIFLEVGQIVSGYTLESELGAEADYSNIQDSLVLGAKGKFVDRPTITYAPLTGASFVRKLLAPIPPSAVLSLIQSGWPADLVLRTTVQAINGRRNQTGMETRKSPADADYHHVVRLIREIQQSGAFGLRIEKNAAASDTTVLFFYHETLDPNVTILINDLQNVLGLDDQLRRYRVAYGAIPDGNDEIAILTRSVIQILIELGSYIDVPAEDIASNRTREASARQTDIDAGIDPLIDIHSGPAAPDDAFARVAYDDNWYWIESNDYASKRVFTFLMLLLMLSETDTRGTQPVLTIPTG